MSVKLTWSDNASNEAGHRIFRKSVDDTEFTLVAAVSSTDPSTTGTIEYVDETELDPGDYIYTVQNYSSNAAAFTNEYTVSIVVEDLREICLSLNSNYIDYNDNHVMIL